MLRSLRLTFVSLACLLTLHSGAWAQFGVPLNHTDPKLEAVTVRELVAHYCRLDYAGARLRPSDWGELQPLVAWQTNPDFSLFMVTSRFDVDTDSVPEHGKYQVTVHYRLLGKYDMSEGYSQELTNQVEDVQYVVSEVNGDWRITGSEPGYPHPSRVAVLQWLTKKLAQTQDPVAKTIYQHAVEQLQPQKSTPLAP